MNTFVEDIKAILDSRMSKADQDKALIKMGLRVRDIQIVRDSHKLAKKRSYTGYKIGNLTFGVEIECYNAPRHTLLATMQEMGLQAQITGYYHQNDRKAYKLAHDGSIMGGDGCECVTPILKGKAGENSLKKACKALNQVGARVNRSCGLHVHFGAEKIDDAHYIRIFKNYQKCEQVIDTFMANSRRANNNRYCKGIAIYNFQYCNTKSDVASVMGHDRYHKVNPQSYSAHKTIEFRQHQGTTDYTKVIMWVQFLRELIEYSYTNEITATPTRVDEIPFISDEVKTYLQGRVGQLN